MWLNYLPEWNDFFKIEADKMYFVDLINNVQNEYKNYICYPLKKNIFNLFNIIKPKNIKVVIIGQDPYHNPNQANGFAFSVSEGVNLPPSLINIFKELRKDLNINHFKSGDLTNWVKQGVFLFNTIWSVRAHKPLSHKDIGWLEFSKNLIIYLNNNYDDIVYVLWGNYAQQYSKFIYNKDNIIRGAHPSPFSYNLFKNQHFFVKINKLLIKNNKSVINWEK